MQTPLPPPVLGEYDKLTRAKQLAEKMARVLNNEDVSDVAIAVALLMSGVVAHYAGERDQAVKLVTIIRKLEDKLLAGISLVEDPKLQ